MTLFYTFTHPGNDYQNVYVRRIIKYMSCDKLKMFYGSVFKKTNTTIFNNKSANKTIVNLLQFCSFRWDISS